MKLKPAERTNLVRRVCASLETGISLTQACAVEHCDPKTFISWVRRFGVTARQRKVSADEELSGIELDSNTKFVEVGGCGSTSMASASFTLCADFDSDSGVTLEGSATRTAEIEDDGADFADEEVPEDETDDEREARREEWESNREAEREQLKANAERYTESEILAVGLRSIEAISDAVDAIEAVCGIEASFSGHDAAANAERAFPWLPKRVPDSDEEDDKA